MKTIIYFLLLLGFIGLTRSIYYLFIWGAHYHYVKPIDESPFRIVLSGERQRSSRNGHPDDLKYNNESSYRNHVSNLADYLTLIGGALLFYYVLV